MWRGCGGGCGHLWLSHFGLGDLLTVSVHADGDLDELTAILVADIDAVLARVVWRYLVDDQAGKLSTIECDLGVFGGGHFLFILEPGHLWRGLTPHCAGQAQRLQEATVSEPEYHQRLCINAINKLFS